jgi:hypothetical protein
MLLYYLGLFIFSCDDNGIFFKDIHIFENVLISSYKLLAVD